MQSGTKTEPITPSVTQNRDTVCWRKLPEKQWPLTRLVLRVNKRSAETGRGDTVPAGLPTEYVVHWWNGESGGFHNGYYTHGLGEALEEFNKRAVRAGVSPEVTNPDKGE